ncbi:MAG: hypothetical protein IPJ28_05310 [Betaproteobacteria bacterium]|nr:hypothetical protein [Betaproteobacteria bacterium]
MDVFRIDIPRGGATLTVRTSGGLDTVGTLLDASGRTLKSVNDAEADSVAFGLTRTLEAGTYDVSIARAIRSPPATTRSSPRSPTSATTTRTCGGTPTSRAGAWASRTGGTCSSARCSCTTARATRPGS